MSDFDSSPAQRRRAALANEACGELFLCIRPVMQVDIAGKMVRTETWLVSDLGLSIVDWSLLDLGPSIVDWSLLDLGLSIVDWSLLDLGLSIVDLSLLEAHLESEGGSALFCFTNKPKNRESIF
ncbi:hypothetical protein EYF80_038782 [Liparis tanakae]|uniref:Uncharacterized protein n=1 Tax=Liparis tanakae TaxID=230148 RepID=A0A4Z2GCK0_9TELE|nr:hypothetical protein EYF80_038782 [Liparis tanakae]